jgi:hypothetical protein
MLRGHLYPPQLPEAQTLIFHPAPVSHFSLCLSETLSQPRSLSAASWVSPSPAMSFHQPLDMLLNPIFKPLPLAGHWWLIPVIFATWEAEIRTVIQSQPR